MGLSEAVNLIINLRLKDLASAGLKGVQSNLQKLEGRLGKIGGIASKGLGTAVGNLQKLGAVAGGAVVSGLAAAVKIAGDFEAQLNTINTVAQVSPEKLTAIGDSIRELARNTGTSTEDLTSAYYDLVSAGIKAADAQGVLTAANTLAIGGLATTGETVDLLTTALNSYGLEASKAGDIADYFAQSIAAGKLTAADLAGSFAQVGSIAAASGIEIEELAATYAQLTAKGTPAAEASTQIRAAIIALQKPTSELEGLQKKLGINFADFARENGLAAAYALIREEGEKAGLNLIELTGRVEGTNYALGVTGENAKGYADNLDLVKKSTEGAGVAQGQAEKRMQGFNFQISKLQGLAKDAAITVGTALLPTLTDLATEAGKFLAKPETQAQIKRLAQDLALGLKELVAAAKKVPWASIGQSLKDAANFGKTLLDAFLGAPEWLKTAVITGWGLNKLTGGALGGIVSELGKGLIKGVLGMTAGYVNIKAGVVTGVGAPGGIPPAAGAGAAGLGLGAAAVGVAGGAVAGGVLATVITAPIVGAVENMNAEGLAKMGYNTEQISRMLELARQEARIGRAANTVVGKEIQARIDAERKEIAAAVKNPPPVSLTSPTMTTMANLFGGSVAVPLLSAAKTSGDIFSVGSQLITDAFKPIAPAIHASGDIFSVGSQLITNAFNAGNAALLGQQKTSATDFATRMGTLRDQLFAQFGQGTQLRQMLAEKLGISVGKLDRLHTVMRSEVAAKLGISVQELRNIKRGADHNEEKIAAKLGISVEQLRAIRGTAREHAVLQLITNNKLEAIKNKDWSPRIVIARQQGSFGGINPMTGKPWGMQHGGPVQAGMPYIVGERRPELFIPNQSGTIRPSVPSGGVSQAPIIVNVTANVMLNTRTVARELSRDAALTLARAR